MEKHEEEPEGNCLFFDFERELGLYISAETLCHNSTCIKTFQEYKKKSLFPHYNPHLSLTSSKSDTQIQWQDFSEHNQHRHTTSQCVSSSRLEDQDYITRHLTFSVQCIFILNDIKKTFLKCLVIKLKRLKTSVHPNGVGLKTHYKDTTITCLNWDSTFTPFHHLTHISQTKKNKNLSSDSGQITSYTCLPEAEVNSPVCKLHGQELVETGMVGLLQDTNLIKKARCLQVRHTR